MMSTVTAITNYHKRLLQHKELDSRACAVRENLGAAKKEFGKTEDDFKSLQSVGQIKKEIEGVEELEPEEVVDLEVIDELQGLAVVSEDLDEEGSEKFDSKVSALDDKDGVSVSNSLFDMDFDNYGKTRARIVEPKFKMTLAELLDESKVVPISVYGDLEVEITGIQHDSRVVSAGDLFVCCVGRKTDGHLYLSEAIKRGAVAVVATGEVLRPLDYMMRLLISCKLLAGGMFRRMLIINHM